MLEKYGIILEEVNKNVIDYSISYLCYDGKIEEYENAKKFILEVIDDGYIIADVLEWLNGLETLYFNSLTIPFRISKDYKTGGNLLDISNFRKFCCLFGSVVLNNRLRLEIWFNANYIKKRFQITNYQVALWIKHLEKDDASIILNASDLVPLKCENDPVLKVLENYAKRNNEFEQFVVLYKNRKNSKNLIDFILEEEDGEK